MAGWPSILTLPLVQEWGQAHDTHIATGSGMGQAQGTGQPRLPWLTIWTKHDHCLLICQQRPPFYTYIWGYVRTQVDCLTLALARTLQSQSSLTLNNLQFPGSFVTHFGNCSLADRYLCLKRSTVFIDRQQKTHSILSNETIAPIPVGRYRFIWLYTERFQKLEFTWHFEGGILHIVIPFSARIRVTSHSGGNVQSLPSYGR